MRAGIFVVVEDFTAGDHADFLHVRIVDVVDGMLTAGLDGELRYGTCAPALELLTDAIAHGETRIVLDLSKLGFCDSAGLRLLVQLQERTTTAGGWLRLAGVSSWILQLLAITRLDQEIPIYPSVEDACQS